MKEVNLILKEIKKALKDVSERKTKRLIDDIVSAKEINLIGHGRSWHVAKSFSMRLIHLGLNVGRLGKRPGKTTNKDLNIVLSGSGESKDILRIVKKIKKSKIICITTCDESNIAKKADLVIEFRAGKSKQPMRSLFEQAALIYLDAIIIKLMKKLKINDREMWKKHD